MADTLGWPYEVREIPRRPLMHLLAALVSGLRPLHPRLPGNVAPPWPDVVIASGWVPALVARWIARRNRKLTRLILMGRRSGPVGESQDIGIHCRHYHLPPHPRQLQTILPPSKASASRLSQAMLRWPALYTGSARPRVALLAGGSSAQHRLDAQEANRMTSRVSAAVKAAGGSLVVLTSRRTGEAVTGAMQAAAGPGVRVEPWAGEGVDNPYLGYLAGADILIVTGESESMLAEAVATGKPVYIYPLPHRKGNFRQRLSDWVYHQSQTDRFNARGSRRPQQGLQYLCARLVEQRLLLPRRDMDLLHRELVGQGAARLFEDRIESWRSPAWNETEIVARRIRALLMPGTASPRDAAPGIAIPEDSDSRPDLRPPSEARA
jgi:mitochondrial fission protein ELM1